MKCKQVFSMAKRFRLSPLMREAVAEFCGAHMNPAVTVAFAVVKRFPLRKVPVYVAAQMLGAFFLGTALLVGCIFAITDKKNNSPNKGVAPVMIGLVVFVIGATFGFNCGYAINPARDLGPRIFTAMAGAGNNWSWVPVIACLMGGITGAFIYIGLIETHHDSDEPNENGRELERIIINE
ncbi:Aquaporin-3 [Acropora cervicornis]|uniref:Aquaporin-3 n=1 Tax=Acropora cervicornis TaxID=6130 RepID=A0AAD9QW47_ACRCE|nr:Aquaporin-3 [Acropora cervicornis]